MSNEARTQIRRLTALASKPEEQIQYALSLLQEESIATKERRSDQQRELIQATLRVLVKRPTPDARPVLLPLFHYYMEKERHTI